VASAARIEHGRGEAVPGGGVGIGPIAATNAAWLRRSRRDGGDELGYDDWIGGDVVGYDDGVCWQRNRLATESAAWSATTTESAGNGIGCRDGIGVRRGLLASRSRADGASCVEP